MKKFYLNFNNTNKLLSGNVSTILDLIRGISAILVVMEHLSSRLFVGYGNVESQSIAVKFLYLLNILGGPSVIVFFVLSGLFISRSILKSIYDNQWSWRTYLINRFSRLYVVLLPALILTFLLDSVAVIYFDYKGYGFDLHNLKTFLGNLFFLQNINVDVYGSNAPLWSLNYEFWYYILFPLILMLFLKNQRIVYKFICLALITLLISSVGLRMNSYFLIWLIGMSVLLLPRINFLIKGITPIIATFFLLVVMVIRPLVMTGMLFTIGWTEDLFIVDLFIGLAFGFFIYSLLHVVSDKIRNIKIKSLTQFSKTIAGFSFSLYLIHYPIINIVYYLAAKNGYNGLQPSLLSIVLEIIWVFLICVVSYLFSKFTEAKTQIVRDYLVSKFSSIKVDNKVNTHQEIV